MAPSSSFVEHHELLDVFSCSHFLSNRKQSVMSKRARESASKEGSAVTKPRPMNLVSREQPRGSRDALIAGEFGKEMFRLQILRN